jgi:hypothetical protein
MGGLNKFYQDIIHKILVAFLFGIFYIVLFFIVIIILVGSIETKGLFDNMKGFGWYKQLLILNYVIDFAFGFILNQRFRTAIPKKVVSSYLLKGMGFGFIFILFLIPGKFQIHISNINLVIVCLTIISKTLVDVIISIKEKYLLS